MDTVQARLLYVLPMSAVALFFHLLENDVVPLIWTDSNLQYPVGPGSSSATLMVSSQALRPLPLVFEVHLPGRSAPPLLASHGALPSACHLRLKSHVVS